MLSNTLFSKSFFFKSRKHFHCHEVQYVSLYYEEGLSVQFRLRRKN